MLNEIRIINWPVEVRPPGPKFELKTLSTIALHMLVSGYIDHKLNGGPLALVPKLERWTTGIFTSFFSMASFWRAFGSDEKAIPIDRADKGNISLVVSVQGVPLRKLVDCKEWREKYEKARKTRKTRMMAAGLVVGDDGSEPELSNRAATSRNHGPPSKPTKPATYAEVTEGPDSDDQYRVHASQGQSHKKHRRDYGSKKRARDNSDIDSHDSDVRRQARKKAKQDSRDESDSDEMVARHAQDERNRGIVPGNHHHTSSRKFMPSAKSFKHTRMGENHKIGYKGKEKAVMKKPWNHEAHSGRQWVEPADEESSSTASDADSEEAEETDSDDWHKPVVSSTEIMILV
jgi:hypothetical protein